MTKRFYLSFYFDKKVAHFPATLCASSALKQLTGSVTTGTKSRA